LYLGKSTAELEAREMCDHRLKKVAINTQMVTSMGEKYVETFENEGFVKYVFNNARPILHTTTSSIEKIRRDQDNIFHHIHTCDITYTFMQRINTVQLAKTELD
jgi:hypothetical protein